MAMRLQERIAPVRSPTAWPRIRRWASGVYPARLRDPVTPIVLSSSGSRSVLA